MNREAWLTNLAEKMRPLFKGFALGRFRVTCGWPCKNPTGMKRRIGECHGLKSSSDGTHEIFVSPLLAKPDEVAGVLCHELAHVAAGIETAHGKGFVRVCRHVGLTRGRPTSVSPGERLAETLKKMTDGMVPYPHGAMVLVPKAASKPKTTQKLSCECGCSVTMPLKWLERSGAPTCGCGSEFSIPGEGD